MKIFSTQRQYGHAPKLELQNGEIVPYAEKPERLDVLRSTFNIIEDVTDFGLEPITAIHSKDYIEFLQTAYADWQETGRPGDAFPYVFPIKGRRPLSLKRIDARLGQYAYDCGTPITEGTWGAVYWNAQTALTAVTDVLDGARSSVALCRPPGHHAGRDYMGGYCYLNNTAIAAQRAIDQGVKRVAILDVDYHHGNGTQDIFYEREDVFTISLHADPVTDYPFYWGHRDERGLRTGEGANLNLPMPRETDWSAYKTHLLEAIEAIEAYQPDIVLIPYGADTFRGDPISFFNIDTDDYAAMGELIASLKLPSIVLMEGGYNIEHLGANVSSFLTHLA